jgi:hypothetical protein
MKTLSDVKVGLGTQTCLEKGQTSLVMFKFQWSYSSSDMSDLRPDMSEKCLWNLINGSNKSDGPDLFWNMYNRFDRCAIPV